uniref:Beta-galactosidase n=1 Tax=Dendroctonus ponderosae TaxID=77166 RepID=J3JXU5_DENPD|nr:unknown [Dendroctonus ponderosae]
MLLAVAAIVGVLGAAADLPTNYQYFTAGGIESGLNADEATFLLNGKSMFVYSGAIHYFRVPRPYWRDRLRKLRAAGFNTVETYIAWNLHEYQSGVFDFGGGGSELEDFLYLDEFLQTAQEEDLFVIVRAGPFICAEFEFGGFPSYLLRDGTKLWVRTDNEYYMDYVTRWFNELMPRLAKHQFTVGGPIIMFQVENEYAGTGYGDHNYLWHLRQLMLDNGIVELLVTADNPWRGTGGTYTEYFLMTFNFDSDVDTNLATMEQLQPGRPLMVMEYWSGWFDYVASGHKTKTLETFQATYEPILARPASVNMYMFIGGTSWGFLSGSQNLAYDDLNTRFTPMTTSYDYSAPLAENGDYTDKYWLAQQLLAQYNPIKTLLPAPPALQGRVAYPSLSLQGQLSLEALIGRAPAYDTPTPVSMENMDINNGSGQSYGFVVYSKAGLRLPEGAQLTIEGRVCDTVIVLVNGRRVSPLLQKAADLDQFGTWRTANSSLTLTGAELEGAQLDLVVENWGRANVGVYRQYKGLWQGGVTINNEPVTGWTMHALEFKRAWTNGLDGWEAVAAANEAPTLYRATLQVEGGAADTYVYMEEWTKGIVVVNGFVLGRYARIGPQQSLYLPAPFLREGANDILIFELFEAADLVQFATDIVYNNH